MQELNAMKIIASKEEMINLDGHVRFPLSKKMAPHVEIQIEPSNTFLYENEGYNVGNILTKGPHVMQKYWGQEEATAAAFRENRWLNTGDAGWIDKEGSLQFCHRSTVIIMRIMSLISRS